MFMMNFAISVANRKSWEDSVRQKMCGLYIPRQIQIRCVPSGEAYPIDDTDIKQVKVYTIHLNARRHEV